MSQKPVEINTKRLILNPPDDKDAPAIVRILNNKIYAQNTLNIPFPYTAAHAKSWIHLAKEGLNNQRSYIFAIRFKDAQQLIGGIALEKDVRFNKAELGYWLAEDYWNNGYTTEAVKAVIAFGWKQLHLKRIFATHFDNNGASGKVLEKAGMKKEGLLTAHTQKNGSYQNHILYAVIRE